MICLEEFQTCDFDRLINWVESEELMVQFGGPAFTYPITHDQLNELMNDKKRKMYRVKDLESGEIIGHAEIGKIDYKNRSARLGRILIGDKNCRGQGYGRQLILKLVETGFNDMKLHRLDLGVYDFNTPAIKCYKSCGFEIEGLLKDSTRFRDTYWSAYNMSIINPEV